MNTTFDCLWLVLQGKFGQESKMVAQRCRDGSDGTKAETRLLVDDHAVGS
jgi:hypothetical protein